MLVITNGVKVKRKIQEKFTDYGLYFMIFGGNTLISGSIVHALEFSLTNIILFVSGLLMTLLGTYFHEFIFLPKEQRKALNFDNYGAALITAVSSGSMAGGILHWQEGPKFGLFIVISGFVLSTLTTLLYSTKPLVESLRKHFLKVAMFAGMSFVSGTIVHSINIWFTNYSLILIGIVLTVGGSLVNEALYKKRSVAYFAKEACILLFLTLGIGGITGGILHFHINMAYAIKLLTIGFAISCTAAMFKNTGTLVELRH